jgi:hypothetical protein
MMKLFIENDGDISKPPRYPVYPFPPSLLWYIYNDGYEMYESRKKVFRFLVEQGVEVNITNRDMPIDPSILSKR